MFQLMAAIATVLGGIALFLTLVGLYGSASYLLGQRRREIGIRMAVGATASDAALFLFRYSMGLTAIGVGIGTALAVAVTQIIGSNMVLILNIYDTGAYATGIAVVALASIAATAGPALNAARVDPASTLRSE